jgi:hypothetical protein
METINDTFVSLLGEDIFFAVPCPRKMSKERALRMAAWIVAITDDNDEFPTVLEAVKNT